jgi:hypothetical protein
VFAVALLLRARAGAPPRPPPPPPTTSAHPLAINLSVLSQGTIDDPNTDLRPERTHANAKAVFEARTGAKPTSRSTTARR